MGEEQQRKAAEKAAAKAEKNRISKIKSDSTKALGKLAAPIAELKEVGRLPGIVRCPEFLQTKLTDTRKRLEELEKEAKEKLKATSPLDLSFDLDTLIATVKDCPGNLIT